ncbi:hypothetical protein AB0L25_40825 [Spirillospora sp. NPDC052242]
MRRKAAMVTAVACGVGTLALAAPAHAAGWRNIPSAALNYNGSLDKVDFGATNAGWAVGSAGDIFSPQAKLVRWNGSAWVADQSPIGFTPTDVAVANANKAWVIGYSWNGTKGLYWNGTKWSEVSYPLVGFPTAVDAAPDGTAWSIAGVDAAAGGPCAILRWTGSAWVDPQVPLPPSSTITAVDVNSANDVWLAGTVSSTGTSVNGLVMHWNGAKWTTMVVPGAMGVPGYQGTMHRIVAHGPNNVYVLRVRQNAQITNALMHWNGSSWRTINTPLNAAGIGLSSDGGSGVVMLPITTGGKSQYMHYDGARWTTYDGPSRTGTVQASDIDARPGTSAVVSTGTASDPSKKVPFIEYFS